MPGSVLGLDASTSVIGVVVLADELNFDPVRHFLHYEAIEFKGCNGFWEKCDEAKKCLEVLAQHQPTIDRFFIEEPMKRFSEGFSSAETLSLLQRFNGIVCYLVRDIWGIDPMYVNVSSARKAAGVRVVAKAKAGGLSAKQQTFEYMTKNDLSHVVWPLKRGSTGVKPFVYDIVDAYVVARGGMELNKAPLA